MNSIMMTANDVMMRILLADGDSSGKFDIVKFLNNTTEYLKKIGHYVMTLAGVILVIVAVVQIAKGFASGGRGQVNWVMSIACLLVGGLLIGGGWALATQVAVIGKDTVEELGGGQFADIDVEGGMGIKGFGSSSSSP